MYKRQILDEIDAIADRNDPHVREAFVKANRAFHDAVFEASGSRKLVEIIARFVEQAIVVRTAAKFTPDDIRRSNQHHKELLRAIENRNGILAESIMRTHILSASIQYMDAFISESGKNTYLI